ncbi:hypothetical protein BDZ97DRAFT_1920836 [Flammula alnicola]|nr:hypothetical protein BDZ97DRAFT_1920836 [Flammula alnicola]
MPEIDIQVGEPWAEDLQKETYSETVAKDVHFDRILLKVRMGPLQHLDEFLRFMITDSLTELDLFKAA